MNNPTMSVVGLGKTVAQFSSVIVLLTLLPGLVSAEEIEEKRYYIVYMGDQPFGSKDSAVQSHLNILTSVKERIGYGGCDLSGQHGCLIEGTPSVYIDAKESMVYSYTKSFNAFAAKLTQTEAQKLSGMDNVLAVIPNQYRKLHTTKSYDFIGLPLTVKRKVKQESSVIVGLFDTGITPEADSFKDDGLDPVPAKWKGSCGSFANFSGCNKKIIGATYFKLDKIPDLVDILSPVDVDGHGTHTSSTLAGTIVQEASLFGLAKGSARGAVPSARVAMYKVCWVSSGCSDMDLLAAFDAAIHDGVDIISVSIGGGTSNYSDDPIAIGSFQALKKGIITLASAGNDGPSLSSVVNHAPWLVTVAASGIDRQFRSKVELGNGKNISGIGVSTFQPKARLYPLVSGVDVARNSASKENARSCTEDSLDPTKVKGKLLFCKLSAWGTDSIVKGFGGTGIIVQNGQYPDNAQIFMAPGTVVNDTIGDIIGNYIQSSESPKAVIYKSHEVNTSAPTIASFSSRGPVPGSKRLLKPDIAAPGIDILAAYTPLKSLTGLKGDTQFSKFTLMSGTSMACPHVAGAAAYIKSFRPNWSPSAIKSALITSARPMSRRVNREAEFAYGAGQLNPTRALNPGLVYEMEDINYIQYLCSEGYRGESLAVLIGSKSTNCSSLLPGFGYDSLNYPTMHLSLKTTEGPTMAVFRRRVTNVGPALSIYNVTIKSPGGVDISVRPESVAFTRELQKRSFKVVVRANPMASQTMVSGSITWKSFRHVVRSPIVIYSP